MDSHVYDLSYNNEKTKGQNRLHLKLSQRVVIFPEPLR